jgi:hypothetical protein
MTPDGEVDVWQELLEAASDVLSDALPVYGVGSTPKPPLTPAMERLNNAVNMVDPPDNDLPN